MRILLNIYLIISFLPFVGCEGFVNISGTVMDKRTNLPVSDVRIECLNCRKFNVPLAIDSINREYIYYTDTTGNFQINTGLTGIFGYNPKFRLRLLKEGYKTRKVKARDICRFDLEPN